MLVGKLVDRAMSDGLATSFVRASGYHQVRR